MTSLLTKRLLRDGFAIPRWSVDLLQVSPTSSGGCLLLQAAGASNFKYFKDRQLTPPKKFENVVMPERTRLPLVQRTPLIWQHGMFILFTAQLYGQNLKAKSYFMHFSYFSLEYIKTFVRNHLELLLKAYFICFSDGNPSNFWTGFGFRILKESVKKKWRIPCGFRILIFGGFRILAIF